MGIRILPVVAVFLGLSVIARADEPAELLGHTNSDALAGTLRGLLVRYAPTTLYEASPNWGDTDPVVNGVTWRGKHLPLRPHLQYKEKNDGVWRKLRVTAENLPNTLIFDLRNVRNPEPGRMTFDVFIAFDAKFHYEQQTWERGHRLYAGSARVRFRPQLLLNCECVTRLEPNGTFVPDAVFRLRVVKADLRYDNFVVEHVGGVGGEGARLIGDGAKAVLREWRPELERELLDRADAAIVKAGDTQEVRLSLSNLFKNKSALPDQALKLLINKK